MTAPTTIIEILHAADRYPLKRGFDVGWQPITLRGEARWRPWTLMTDQWTLWLPVIPHQPYLGDIIEAMFKDKTRGKSTQLDLVVDAVEYDESSYPVKTTLRIYRNETLKAHTR